MRGIKEVDVVLQNKSLPLRRKYKVGVHTYIYICVCVCVCVCVCYPSHSLINTYSMPFNVEWNLVQGSIQTTKYSFRSSGITHKTRLYNFNKKVKY